MSVKIKINWDNENVMSESVRIYRADSAFTSANLPPLLAEVVGDVYEYEDLDVTQDQTYFYMLSAKLGDQEVFTECFEVLSILSQSFEKIVSFGTSTTLLTNSNSQCSFYSEDGLKLYQVLTSMSGSNLVCVEYSCSTAFGAAISSSAITKNVYIGVAGSPVMISFFDNGFGCIVSIYVAQSRSYKLAALQLTTAYDISTAVFKSITDRSSETQAVISNDKKYLIEGSSNGIFKISEILGDIYSSYTLNASTSYNISELNAGSLYTFEVSKDGKTMIVVSGSGNTSQIKKIVSIKTDTKYDFSSYVSNVLNRGTARDLVRINSTNRFIYADLNFLLLHIVDTNYLTKQNVTFEEW